MRIKNVLIGCDPEGFLFDPIKEKYVPVCGLVGGTKDEPIPITDEGHGIQEDNVMVEYTIPPSKTIEEFKDNINFVKDYIAETVLKPLNLVPHYVASARFDIEDLMSQQAQHFGCSPDYNAYTMEANSVQRTDMTLRTSGGHIHVGYDEPSVEANIDLIRAMDLFLGVPSILLDTDTERRKMYGKAGCYRFKKYGLEYRVLSTFWTANDELIEWAFNATKQAIDFVNKNGIITNPEQIIDCINNSNKDLALEILDDYNINVNLKSLII
mgnify:CR=1 FL=1